MSEGAPAILPDARTRWLNERRSMLTASDVAAVLGKDEGRGALAVYLVKVGEVEVEDNEPMKWGRRLEDAIAEGYAEATGRTVETPPAYEITRHPDLPWLGATLDRRTAGSTAYPAPFAGQAPLQLKAVSEWKRSKWDVEPPLGYQVQVQIEMACSGAPWGSLCAFMGITRPPAWTDLLRNDAFLAAAIPRLDEFMWRVRRREPPEADELPGTSEAVEKLWGDGDGETVELDQAALDLVGEWETAQAAEAKGKKDKKRAGNKLRMRLGRASFGTLPDGSLLSLKTTQRDGYTVEPVEYRVLRRRWPRLPRR